MSLKQYYSDEEIPQEEQQIYKEYQNIKHFTLADYLECTETRTIIEDEWNTRIEETIEPELYALFDMFLKEHKHSGTGLFDRATTQHATDFFLLIKHHLVKKYSTSMFEENPTLASPLVRSLDAIRLARKNRKTQHIRERFQQFNQEFSWKA